MAVCCSADRAQSGVVASESGDPVEEGEEGRICSDEIGIWGPGSPCLGSGALKDRERAAASAGAGAAEWALLARIRLPAPATGLQPCPSQRVLALRFLGASSQEEALLQKLVRPTPCAGS